MRLNGETETWRIHLAIPPGPEPRSAAVVCLSSFRCRWGPPAPSVEVGGEGAKAFLAAKRRVSHDPLSSNQRVYPTKRLILLS